VLPPWRLELPPRRLRQPYLPSSRGPGRGRARPG
jgi:hypothetical protein